MNRHSMHDRLSEQRALVGFMQLFPNQIMTEIAGHSGFDFVMIDCEHGMFSDMDVLSTLQVAASTGMAGVVRIRGHDASGLQNIGRYLDAGADGIIVPNVGTVEQARAIAKATQYAPDGTRGFAASAHRVTRYGADLGNHLSKPAATAFLIALIETRDGVKNLDSILNVEGIDAVLVGPADLTAELGKAADFSLPGFHEALSKIEAAATAARKPLGIPAGIGGSIDEMLARGYRLFIAGSDALVMREGMQGALSKAQACFAAPTTIKAP